MRMTIKPGYMFPKVEDLPALLMKPSVFALVLANVATIVLAIIGNWDVLSVLWIYWFQSVIIGIFNVPKMFVVAVRNHGPKGIGIAAPISLFFIFHYGMFHLVYAIFLGVFTMMRGEIAGLGATTAQTDPYLLGIAVLIFAANHLFSFLYNFRKDKKTSLAQVMFFPYARIFPMHLTIIFGGMFLVLGTGSAFVLVLFIALKTIVDVAMHIAEHAQPITKAKTLETQKPFNEQNQ